MKAETNASGWTEDMDDQLLHRRGVLKLPWKSVGRIGGHSERKCQARYKFLLELEAKGQARPAQAKATAAEIAEARRARKEAELLASSKDGIDWLLKKGRLTARRHNAARAYQKAFRDGGGLSLKSSADIGAGGGTPGPGLHQENGTVAFTQAKRDLHVMQTQVLWSQLDLVTVMDGVCGAGMTPRELAGGDGHKANTIEAVLMVALDLVARWLDVRPRTHG